jgi:hypothetical protein
MKPPSERVQVFVQGLTWGLSIATLLLVGLTWFVLWHKCVCRAW